MAMLAGMAVARTIELDGESRFFAEEIEIVNSFGMLATELVAAKTPVAQPAPHELFCPSFSFAERSSTGDIGHDETVIPAT